MEYHLTIQDLKQVGYLKQEVEALRRILDSQNFDSATKESIRSEVEKKISELQELYSKVLHWIFSIDDSLIRLIFEEKYLNLRTWNQVADIVGGLNTEDSVKKMAYRYLEKKVIE